MSNVYVNRVEHNCGMCKSLDAQRFVKFQILFTSSQSLISLLGLRHDNNCHQEMSAAASFTILQNTLTLHTLCKHSATMCSSKQACKTKMKVIDTHNKGEGYKMIKY